MDAQLNLACSIFLFWVALVAGVAELRASALRSSIPYWFAGSRELLEGLDDFRSFHGIIAAFKLHRPSGKRNMLK
ncbi:MAG: hypothetical protein O3C28_05625 [Proteobacteria bacterium]|nr:hypothetical protein [Pseudomonadota bacterium]